MVAGPGVTTFVDQLVDLFNRRSMDLPDGVFTRHTQFLLNSIPFEETLGRPASDPLILMLTRGPAGYRFTAKALQHAVPDAVLQRGELVERTDGATRFVQGQYWLSGHLRGDGELVEMMIDIEMRFRGHTLDRVNANLHPAQVARLSEARHRP
jgi:hypothetical protein